MAILSATVSWLDRNPLTIVDAALPEARRNMFRRAQTIGIKDSGFLISWMGIGVGNRVLEGGHGSAGLAMHLANVMGSDGTLISVENRAEHAAVGRQNMERMAEFSSGFPDWHLIEGDLSEASGKVKEICAELDAAIIDIAEPWTGCCRHRIGTQSGRAFGLLLPDDRATRKVLECARGRRPQWSSSQAR